MKSVSMIVKKCLRLCMIAAAVMCMSPAVPAADRVTAGKVHVEGLYSIEKRELLDTMGIREGSAVTAEQVRDGIKRAFLKGIFEDIAVHVPDGPSPDVFIRVRERDFISSVRIQGEYGVSRQVIRDLFPMKEDMEMRYDSLQSASREVELGLAKRGFPAARVSASVRNTSRPHRVFLEVEVQAGQPLIIRETALSFEPGSAPASDIDEGIWRELRLGSGDVYSEVSMEIGVRRIREFLKRQGYFKPAVGPWSFRDGSLSLSVNPGKRLVVKMDGNSALSEDTLLREAPFFENETFTDDMVDEAMDRMTALYHSKGYPYAQIAPVVNADDRSITLTLFVFEGERIKVGTVSFRGISLPPKRLQGIMSLAEGQPYNADSLDRDKDSLREFYGALGYLDASVKSADVSVDRGRGVADITVVIEEGMRTELGSVEFKGASADMMPALRDVSGLKPGDPYNEVDISDARLRLLEYYGSKGYTGVDISVTRSMADRKAAIVFVITEGTPKVFGETVIVGNRQTRYEVIRRELLHREGEPFNARLFSEERRRLYRLGLFTDLEVDSVDAAGNRRDVILRVSEGKAGWVEFGLGYGDFEKYRGMVEVGYRNLWGMNRQGSFRVELSSLEKRLLLQYNEPWLFGTPLPLKVFFLHENRRELNVSNGEILYRLNRYAINAGVEKKLGTNTKGEFSYEFSIVHTADVKPDVILTREDTGTIAISGVKPALVYDTRDNPIDPRSGILAGMSLKIASLVFLSEANFAKLELHGAHFRSFGSRVTLALSLRGGVAYGIGKTEQLPIVERFFLGGRTTVRGYSQDTLGPKGADGNPTGGNAFFAGTLECRTIVGRGIGLVPFFDVGSVWVKTADINPKDLKYTAGLGLRYSTPVGPLSVDYGYKLSRETGESRGEFHFSVGHAF